MAEVMISASIRDEPFLRFDIVFSLVEISIEHNPCYKLENQLYCLGCGLEGD